MANLAGGLVLLLVVGTYLLFDYLAASSLYPVVALFVALASVPCCLLIAHTRPRAVRVVIPLLVVALLLAVPAVNWNTRKPFLRSFKQIAPGLTIAQVDHLMALYLRGPAAPGVLSGDGTVGYRHTVAGWGDADIGMVYFVDGRASRSQFLPD